MRRDKIGPLRLIVGLILCAVPGWAQATVEVGTPEAAPTGWPILLRVMTYNLHHGAGLRDEATLTEMARLLRDSGLDVAGLQEVDRRWSARSGYADQVSILTEATGFHGEFFPTLARGQDSSYGLAVLTRFPMRRQAAGLYRETREPRGYLAVEIGLAGQPVSFVVTHLGLDAVERAAQVAELSAVLSTLPGPLVLVGDFNCRPDDPAVRAFGAQLRDALAAVGKGGEGTLVTGDGQPGARIDFIFATPEFRIEQCSVPAVDYSDHRPVLAALTFYQANQAPEASQ